MTDDMASRDALRELLFDGVTPPDGSDAMFARTFAAEGGDGSELLPPDDLFAGGTDEGADDPGDLALFDDTDPADGYGHTDTDGLPDDLVVADDHTGHDGGHDGGDDAHDGTDGTGPGTDPHHDGDPGTGW
ncbi:hypothetical protein I4I73_26140 [Pseudonocardia sp. KRD-184]|uniref:Uncharacterized protein n=1 Tax=Pseudonocardia oceani TaxID=2792013 RepID=A0ABS6UJL8_9PSEU|nr:hypothetical protein [Pseudonocardia oceani]MBW0092598.1 hypothetical protein [Pseudonocardia oceani]MBW0099481.1 hypothetical protein [Pseudonocardia oceani]MBW0112024.1 hypothetical protein [Pseudonocardia oceani]MBW0124884.1 hypothetical protein [Pseudonocardia oceani]MBW0132029.1 hypothetical protein [Pseudonocardia oceani]